MNATTCIELLWQDGFFKDPHTLREVSDHIKERWNNNFSLADTSKALQKHLFLRRIGKRGRYQYIQKVSAENKEDSISTGALMTTQVVFLNLHPKIVTKCKKLFNDGSYPEAVEKSFKVVRDRLRELSGYEKGSDAFGRGHIYIKGSSAKNVDEDFQAGVKFLTMAIDMFRNEKSHTSDGNINDSHLALEYLHMSSLAMNFLDRAMIKP